MWFWSWSFGSVATEFNFEPEIDWDSAGKNYQHNEWNFAHLSPCHSTNPQVKVLAVKHWVCSFENFYLHTFFLLSNYMTHVWLWKDRVCHLFTVCQSLASCVQVKFLDLNGTLKELLVKLNVIHADNKGLNSQLLRQTLLHSFDLWFRQGILSFILAYCTFHAWG